MTPAFDVTVRWIPGSLWWRFHARLSLRRGDFESGWNEPLYRGLVHRWAVRIGPLNLAVLRLR